ncbi:hypothetical protein P7K49_033544 [Saguinus oedipus]|uniref:Uncharacterized protein n=1 Tax=Saguinus oedipus TaxID=9490 RepID=A0ABQ9TTY9_SAGOE|nr:hypothetical protein P7K49_033544 [Saguinus oedipus]
MTEVGPWAGAEHQSCRASVWLSEKDPETKAQEQRQVAIGPKCRVKAGRGRLEPGPLAPGPQIADMLSGSASSPQVASQLPTPLERLLLALPTLSDTTGACDSGLLTGQKGKA